MRRESGIDFPTNILNRAENSRLLIEGIHFYEKGNLDVSSLVMEKILKEDPTNFTAFYYKNFINQRINGDKIQDFFNRAKEFRNAKNYKKERDLYLQILSLQPENQNAKLGFQEALVLESESEREDGERQESNHQIFTALQKYLVSLKILDSNAKSKANLTRLRQKELKNIPAYIQKGKGLYESRKYGESEDMFQNILLVEPENKNAKEYLRLSKEKKIAMLKYENCIREMDKKCYLLWGK
jgi:tetratricopeptide (TPR) repeat protein